MLMLVRQMAPTPFSDFGVDRNEIRTYRSPEMNRQRKIDYRALAVDHNRESPAHNDLLAMGFGRRRRPQRCLT